jgi:hypothetical protein
MDRLYTASTEVSPHACVCRLMRSYRHGDLPGDVILVPKMLGDWDGIHPPHQEVGNA